MIQSESLGELTKALVEARKQFKPVVKQSENPFFKRNGKPSKYADLETAIEATQDALAANKLTVVQFPISKNNPISGAVEVGVFTTLIHESGEFIGEGFTLPLGKQDAQTGVAAVTYARRTGYLGALGIAAEDDDGNTAAGRNSRKEAEEPTIPQYNDFRGTEALREELPPEIFSAGPPFVVEAPPKEVMPEKVPQNGNLPDEKQLEGYRQQIMALQKDLVAAGLKASRGITLNRKIILYLLSTAGTQEVKDITVNQWTSTLDFFSKSRSAEGGVEKLVKLINGVALKQNKTEEAPA